MKIETTGLNGTTARLRGIQTRTEQWDRVGPRLHTWLIARQKKIFQTEGLSEGKRWVRYGRKYTAYKQALVKRGYLKDMSKLRWRGGKERLYPSLTQQSHQLHVFRRQGDGFVFGTRLKYAKRLNDGIGKNQFGEPVAARPFAVISEHNQEKLAKLLLLYIRDAEQDNGWDI